MNTIYALAAHRWSGPIILILCSLLLPLVLPHANLAWGMALLGTLIGLWGFWQPNRWLVGLSAAFVSSLLAFDVQTLALPQSSLAFIIVFGVGMSLILWLLPTRKTVDIILGYAGGIALVEFFLILIYWPVNFPSRALLLTAGTFLLFELIERRTRHVPQSLLIASLAIVVVAISAVVLTAKWYSF